MPLSKAEAQKKYASLWGTMVRDFEDTLDAPTFAEFESNISDWAGIRSSEATQALASPIWNELHEPTIEEANTKNHYRDRFTGKYRSREDYEAQAKR